MEAYQWGGFATGCCIMFCGLYFLAPVTGKECYTLHSSRYTRYTLSPRPITDDDDDDLVGLDVGGDGCGVPPAPAWKDEYSTGGADPISVRAREFSVRERQGSMSRERQSSIRRAA